MSDGVASDRVHAVEPLQPDKSIGELFGELTSDLGHLFRQEVQLAKTEAREEMQHAGKGAGMLAAAGVCALLGLILISLAAAWWLDKAMDRGAAFALVALVWLVIAVALATLGKKRLAAVRPLPQTVDTLKEDMRWAKAQTS
jgi:uncharacterized membrane protein YqjE